MTGIVRLGDVDDAGCGHSARGNDKASENVFVNGIAVHRVTDTWPSHCNPVLICHTSETLDNGSSVYVNGLSVARIGDELDCGATIAEGSTTVIAN